MLPFNLPSALPNSDELVDSDDFPVDNEDQNFVPNVLLFLLEYIWKHREDWYFGVDMGIYHTTGAPSESSSWILECGSRSTKRR